MVAVSIITTFLTPYMIRFADPAYRFVAQRFGHYFKRIDADRVATELAAANSATAAEPVTPRWCRPTWANISKPWCSRPSSTVCSFSPPWC